MDPLSAAERILAAIRAIPRGETAAYGVIAQRAGLPGRARLVARLLSQNDDPKLPWHRVLRSDGRSAFPPGTPHHEEQIKRLRREGVKLDDRGRVLAAKRTKSIDEEVWGGP
ncbi:MAG: MGMT family protein [Xanthomonadaceae bacterium]|nr:MGMT family protein [Xanthomonadaceae bacterium]